VGANVEDYFPHSRKQLRIIQSRFVHLNAVAAELPRIANQTRSMSQRSHRNWAIVGRHSAELSLSHQRSPGAEVARAHRRNYAGWATSDDKHVQHIQNFIDPEN
jgi:thymidylate synthase